MKKRSCDEFYLAEAVVEGKSFDAKLFHSLQLLFIEILKFVPDDKHEEICSKRFS